MNQAIPFPSSSFLSGKWRFLCLALAWTALALIVIGIPSTMVQVLYPQMWPQLFPASWGVEAVKLHNVLDITTVPIAYRAGILACESVSTGLGIWFLWELRLLLLGFTRGEVFTAVALRHLSHIALALLLGEIADSLSLMPESVLATWYLGHGHREMQLSFSSDDIFSLFFAGVAFVIARVMAEARRIADDNASIV